MQMAYGYALSFQPVIHRKSDKCNAAVMAYAASSIYIAPMLDRMSHKSASEDGKMAEKDGEFSPFRLLPGDLQAGLVLICDHASNAFPPGYGTLGLAEDQLERHIGYDIGAGAVTEQLAAALNVPALLTCYSRLLIDPNRGEDDPTLVMRISDGAVVPGNAGIDQGEIELRKRLYYRPYHEAVSQLLDDCIAAGVVPAILSIHSFTPAWKGVPRPWDIGVLWDEDERLAVPLISAFQHDGSLVVGDNEPYTGELEGDTMNKHGTGRGLAHALIEIRQDLIAGQDGVDEWAVRLAEIVPPLLKRAEMHQIRDVKGK